MADKTTIEWTDSTWSPVTGCTKVSPGCDNCYAEGIARRFAGSKAFPNGFDVTLHPKRLDQPLKWRKPRRIFVNSMSDLFHDAIPDEYIAKVFGVMAAAPRHTFQIVTKRHGRMRSLLNDHDWRSSVYLRESVTDLAGPPRDIPSWPLPNVWLGVSVEDQRWADIRIPALLETPAAVRWISAEPLLGPIDLAEWLGPRCRASRAQADRPFLDWVVTGGESGPGARPMHPDWPRSLRDQCQEAGVPFFMKQAGTVLAKEWGCSDRKGHDPAEWPETFPREYANA